MISTQEEKQKIVKQTAAAAKPDKIVIFGPRAYSIPGKDTTLPFNPSL